jgi:hypothetical protein
MDRIRPLGDLRNTETGIHCANRFFRLVAHSRSDQLTNWLYPGVDEETGIGQPDEHQSAQDLRRKVVYGRQ